MTAPTPGDGSRAPRAWRARLFALHRWVGVHLGLPLFVVCSSGTLAVLGHEWDWLGDPARRAVDAAVDWERVGATLDRELGHVDWEIVAAPTQPGHAAYAFGDSPTGQLQSVWLDPVSGDVQGRRNVLSVQVYLRQFHKSFVVPYGLYLVTALGIALLVSAVTGLTSYRRFWRHLFRLRFGAGGRVWVADLHRTLGVWTFLLALVVAVTGVWYLVEAAAHDVADAHVEPGPPSLSRERLLALGPTPTPLALGALVAAAREAMPDLDVRMVRLPRSPDELVRIDGRTGAWLVRDRASRVYLDPYSGEVLGEQRAERLGALHRWSDTADPLHFGDFGGLGTKLIWFVLGVLLSVAVLAGPVLAELRRARHTATRGVRSRWLRPTVIVSGGVAGIGLCAAIAASWIGWDGPILRGHGPPTRVAGPVEVGPWRLVVSEHRDTGGGGAALRVHHVGPGQANWAGVAVETGNGAAAPLDHGEAWIRDSLDAATLRVDAWGGGRHEVPLALVPARDARPVVASAQLDEAPIDPPVYVVGWVLALLALELAGVALWAWLAWRAASTGRGGTPRRSRDPGSSPVPARRGLPAHASR